MKEVRFTLLTDGSSDRALIPVLAWLVHQKLPATPTPIEWADLSRLPRAAKGLASKILAAVEYYPCEVLFVHRDAEREPRENRVAEIKAAIQATEIEVPFICVIPVRMQEAWLLIDEQAIRSAAGNPHGKVALALPKLQTIEDLPDQKDTLHDCLRTASELHGRRLKQFAASAHAFRVAELVEDWGSLRKLAAFIEFEKELDQVLGDLGVSAKK